MSSKKNMQKILENLRKFEIHIVFSVNGTLYPFLLEGNELEKSLEHSI